MSFSPEQRGLLEVGLRQRLRLTRAQRLWWALSVPVLLVLTSCSGETGDEWRRAAMPEGASDRSDSVINFWQWTWVTALIVGALVWGLILFAVVKYRRRSDDEVPVQTRYNLPMELLYTIAPVIVVLVFFKFVIGTQEVVTNEVKDPDHTVVVVGWQWSWTFNYVKDPALDNKTTVFEPGTGQDLPVLTLPVNESVHIKLRSPDVIHSFWVPAFTFKRDVIPGLQNNFYFTPTRTGTFEGRCSELCGTYHSRMLFTVNVVSAEKYAQVLQKLQSQGNTGLSLGGSESTTQVGLDEGSDSNSGSEE